MWPSEDGTNYVINTCEWDNGPHTLFATATESTMPDTAGNIGLTGHAVSPFLTVYFSNLVTRISFSQQFFEPSLGQTQQVSAIFAAKYANGGIGLARFTCNHPKPRSAASPEAVPNNDAPITPKAP